MEVSSLVINIFLNLSLHILDDLSELLSEHIAEESTGHIKSLFTVVISVILSCSSQISSDETTGHVSCVEGFLKLITLFNSNMR